MTMDILGQVLSRSDNPKELGRYLAEEIRELTGARCVLLVRGPDAPDAAGRKILTVHPHRRKEWAESDEVIRFFEDHMIDTTPSVFHSCSEGMVPDVLMREGFQISIAIPLRTGNSHVGVLFALGLPDIIHIDSVVSLLDTLSTIVALVLRNASLYELQDKIIEERTYEVQAAYEEIRSELEERKKIEENLASTNAYLENLITYANVPIIVWDPDCIITRINQAFELLIGKTTGDLLKKPISVLFPAGQVLDSMKIIEGTRSGNRLNTAEIPILHNDGSVRLVLWNTAPIYLPEGQVPVATIAQGRDITFRKKLERENEISLAQIQKNLAQLSILNDEIRNPLSILCMCADMSEDEKISDLIMEQSKRIDAMVDQLDRRWVESEKVLNMIRKNYQIEPSLEIDGDRSE